MRGSRTLIYFCYGAQATYDQTIFSILTVLLHAGDRRDFAIAVYCDRPATFAALPVDTVLTDAALLDRYLGGGDYIHRRKTMVVIDALERFGGKIIFLDSDTYATASPARLFDRIGPAAACFHIREGLIHATGTPFDAALLAQLTARPYHLRSGEPVRVDRRTAMWNTGVVGVEASHLDLMHDALALSDAIWAGADPRGPYGKKIHHAEQFAMGHVFRHCRLREADDLIHHYWRPEDKAAFAAILPDLVASGLADQSRDNLRRLYRRRYRRTGMIVQMDRAKMALRKWALAARVPLRGVRRSV